MIEGMMNSELKEQAIQLRLNGISVKKIAKQLGVASSTISIWTRGITLTLEQKTKLFKREITDEQAVAHSNYFKNKRLQCQKQGRIRIKNGDPLYVAGCMLYWGEGGKNINSCHMVNSELPMLILFKNFLEKFFGVTSNDITIRMNSYTDIHSQEEIEKYWLDGLNLPKSSLRKSIWNQYPKSSKKKNVNKSAYGTCTIQVGKTEIIQEIFGAIQEFGNFENEKWLTKRI